MIRGQNRVTRVTRDLSAFLFLVFTGSRAWAANASVCTPSYCNSQTVCNSGQAQFTDDLPGGAYGIVSWRSQIYGSLDRTKPAYCFFRAMFIDNPNKDLLPLFWEPGGIVYSGDAGHTSGCLVVCSSGSSDLKPATNPTPLPGYIYAGLIRPRQQDAPSWGPDGGWSVITKSEPTSATAISQSKRDEAIIYDNHNGVFVNIRVSSIILSTNVITYALSNVGKTDVTATWNIPVNSSMRIDEGFFVKPLNLKVGKQLDRTTKIASNEKDKEATAVSSNSLLRIDAAGVGAIVVTIGTFTASNGSYQIEPTVFLGKTK